MYMYNAEVYVCTWQVYQCVFPQEDYKIVLSESTKYTRFNYSTILVFSSNAGILATKIIAYSTVP